MSIYTFIRGSSVKNIPKGCSVHYFRIEERAQKSNQRITTSKVVCEQSRCCVSPIVVVIDGVKPLEDFSKNTLVELEKAQRIGWGCLQRQSRNIEWNLQRFKILGCGFFYKKQAMNSKRNLQRFRILDCGFVGKGKQRILSGMCKDFEYWVQKKEFHNCVLSLSGKKPTSIGVGHSLVL